MNGLIVGIITINEMIHSRKRSLKEEEDHLWQKCLKASQEASVILKAYPDGKMPLPALERYHELIDEQSEYARMHSFFKEELGKKFWFA